MEVDEGPPPFNGITMEEHSTITLNKINSIDDDDDDEEDDAGNLSLPQEDLKTAQSFSNESQVGNRQQKPVINSNETFEISNCINNDNEDEWGDFGAATVSSKTEDDEDKEGDAGNLSLPHDDLKTAQSFSNESQVENRQQQSVINTNKSPEISNCINNDEEDEWGDFGAATVSSKTEDDEDEWGDFDQARPSTEENEEMKTAKKLAHQQSLEDWGTFESNQKTDLTLEDEDDWQAEFTSSSQNHKTEIPQLKLLDEMLEDQNFWSEGFDDLNDDPKITESLRVEDIPEIFDNQDLSDLYIEQDWENRKFAKLWISLRVVEEAVSLKFEWKTSQVRLNHFESLKIDPNRVAKTGKSIFDTSILLLPTPLKATITESTTTTTPIDSTLTSSPSATTESPSVPVVDFDWDTSGLTNPLKGASQSSAIIDVDFLSTNGVANSFTNPLQKDLAEFGLATISENQNYETNSTILESIMSKANEGRKSPYKDSKVLSLDAKNLLDQLPDLDYLQSSMLMFPMGSGISKLSQ